MDCMACLCRRRKDPSNGLKPTKVAHNADVNFHERVIPSPTNAAFSPTGFQPERTIGAVNFTMAELNRITSNFAASHMIGQGYLGNVYQGRLRDGTMLAIKRSRKDTIEARDREFQNEIAMLSQVEHLNLVKLMGSLEDEIERLLVTEYVSNGNLRQHLDVAGPAQLPMTMSTRLCIAIDVAQALAYLHYYTDNPIIHRDVKSSNILITDNYRAKVADFGFSRAGPSGEEGATHVSTQIRGTAGYLDPEYLTTYQLNVKSDVYSFGILLVEIFTGRRPIELHRPSDERVTVRWAFKKYLEGQLSVIIDPRLRVTRADMGILESVFQLAFNCSAPTKADRPDMIEVNERLWEIRRNYQLINNRQQGGSGAEPEHGDNYDNGTHTPRETRRPHGGARTNRRPDEHHRGYFG